MAKSLRSRKKKRVKASKGELLKSKQTHVTEREEKKMQILKAALEAPKQEPHQEKNTILLLAKRAEKDELKAKIKAEKAAAKGFESISFEEEGDLSPIYPETQEQILHIQSELGTLRRQIGRRKGKPKGQMFQEERKSRVKQLVTQLKALQSKSTANRVQHDVSKLETMKKIGRSNPLGIKSGGVMKRKGVRSDQKAAKIDDDDDADEMDMSDPEAEKTLESADGPKHDDKDPEDANAFDGGVQLKLRKARKKTTGGRLGSEWLRKKPDNKMKRYGTTRAARGRRKFEFKGIYQFYPKPVPSKQKNEG